MRGPSKKTPQVLLGFDYGSRVIGVAVGQCITKTARSLALVSVKEGVPDWKKIKELIKEWRADAVVVGVPLNMDGTRQPFTEQVEVFIQGLKNQVDIPVYTVDERLTTYAAKHRVREGLSKKSKERLDGVAAEIILESWFSTQVSED